MTTIASAVEGDGEERALPVLVRTLAAVHGVAHVDVPRPFRLPRSKFLVPEESAALDLDRARECRWFRKLEKELLAILRG